MLRDPQLGLVVTLPSTRSDGITKRSDSGDRRRGASNNEDLQRFERFFRNAKLYAQATQSGVAGIRPDPRYDAMVPYSLGEKPVMFRANGYQAILEVLLFAEALELQPVIVGGRDAWKLADLLAEKQVPVIYEGTFATPSRVWGTANASDTFDANYRALSVLHAAGVRFCVAHQSSDLAKLMPLEVGFAIAHGLSPDAALRAMTLSAAEILGIDDELGSLEAGKVANLIVTTDHPCQATNKVLGMFVAASPCRCKASTPVTRESSPNVPSRSWPPCQSNFVGPRRRQTNADRAAPLARAGRADRVFGSLSRLGTRRGRNIGPLLRTLRV